MFFFHRGRKENTEANRHLIRKTFFETPGLNAYIGGAILHAETLECKDTIEPLIKNNIVLGIKTDKGLAPLEGGHEGEQTTKGLDTLKDESTRYYKLGARFAKWRSVILIGKNTPSEKSYEDVSEVLGEYAKISQDVRYIFKL